MSNFDDAIDALRAHAYASGSSFSSTELRAYVANANGNVDEAIRAAGLPPRQPLYPTMVNRPVQTQYPPAIPITTPATSYAYPQACPTTYPQAPGTSFAGYPTGVPIAYPEAYPSGGAPTSYPTAPYPTTAYPTAAYPSSLPTATPVHAPSGDAVRGATGQLLAVGDRVSTQHTWEEGGDGSWYFGVITHLRSAASVTILYDDGSNWTGESQYVHSGSLPQPSALPPPSPQRPSLPYMNRHFHATPPHNSAAMSDAGSPPQKCLGETAITACFYAGLLCFIAALISSDAGPAGEMPLWYELPT
jgi:hypothetical protein